MTVVAIVQARMNSSRLPGKVLKPLAGMPVLGHVVERLSYCRLVDSIVVATSLEASDDIIEVYCEEMNVKVFRGSLDDVLDRYYQAAQIYEADSIVRITADCPAIDPVIVDAVITGFLSGNYDFYGLGGEFPDGLDCSVFAFSAIERAWREASLKSEREHVGPYIENNPDLFRNGSLNIFNGLSNQRWTLDEYDDYRLLTKIFEKLYRKNSPFMTHQVLNLLKAEPSLYSINNGITRNEGYINSLIDEGTVK